MRTEHFSEEELMCKCGCRGMGFSGLFLLEMEMLRKAYGEPMTLSSAYRCPKHNNEVGDTGDAGPHTIGAIDVLVNGEDAYRLLSCALKLGWTGIGISQKGPHNKRFIHLDRLERPGFPRPWIWSY